MPQPQSQPTVREHDFDAECVILDKAAYSNFITSTDDRWFMVQPLDLDLNPLPDTKAFVHRYKVLFKSGQVPSYLKGFLR